MRLRTIVISGLLLTSSVAKAGTEGTIDSLIFYESHVIDTLQKGDLRVNIDNVNFFRDNEYKGKLTKGYTLPGFWFRPTVSYQPLRNLRIEAGAHFLHYWGASKYPSLNYSDMPEWKGAQNQTGFHVLPVLRAQVALTPNFQIVLGTLYGRGSHALIEPLYNQEVGLSGDPETGIQFLWDLSWLNLDMWTNWESFIFDKDYHEESFTFGLSTRFRLNNPLSAAHVYIPLQVVAQHRGGEINTEAEDREVKTWMNTALGVGVRFNMHNRYLTSIWLESYGVAYSQVSGGELPFDDGYGVYTMAGAQLWRFNISGGLWWSKDYISIHGNPLFGAMSIYETDYIVDEPRMIRFHADYTQPIGKGFSVGMHADVYDNLGVKAYDNENGWSDVESQLSFAFGIYLRINTSFVIKKF